MEYRKTARKNPVTVSFSSNLVKRRRMVWTGRGLLFQSLVFIISPLVIVLSYARVGKGKSRKADTE